MDLFLWTVPLAYSIVVGLIVVVTVYLRANRTSSQCVTMLVLGSGGHTAELLPFIDLLPSAYSPRIYIVAATDKLSGQKAEATEAKRAQVDVSWQLSYMQIKICIIVMFISLIKST